MYRVHHPSRKWSFREEMNILVPLLVKVSVVCFCDAEVPLF